MRGRVTPSVPATAALACANVRPEMALVMRERELPVLLLLLLLLAPVAVLVLPWLGLEWVGAVL
jgi:hypothetical protein